MLSIPAELSHERGGARINVQVLWAVLSGTVGFILATYANTGPIRLDARCLHAPRAGGPQRYYLRGIAATPRLIHTWRGPLVCFDYAWQSRDASGSRRRCVVVGQLAPEQRTAFLGALHAALQAARDAPPVPKSAST